LRQNAKVGGGPDGFRSQVHVPKRLRDGGLKANGWIAATLCITLPDRHIDGITDGGISGGRLSGQILVDF
jgi:hypothetical protein